MRVGFICPNGDAVPFDACMRGCHLGDRCLTKSTLQALTRVRPWTGKPSTTQLINPTRLEYLKLTNDFYVAPPTMAFALLGTRVHLGLADADTDISLLEEHFEDEDMTGQMDSYELEPGQDAGILTDYKTWGSYRVARALGVVKVRVPDPTGAVYQRSGNGYTKGDPKMVSIFEKDPNAVKIDDVEYQLNRYRLFLEPAGFPVKALQVEAIVRDGGTRIAYNRGVTEPMYLIPVAILPNAAVLEYFNNKGAALISALLSHRLPPECTDDECWEGKRCRGYCDVWEFCDKGLAAHAPAADDQEGEAAAS